MCFSLNPFFRCVFYIVVIFNFVIHSTWFSTKLGTPNVLSVFRNSFGFVKKFGNTSRKFLEEGFKFKERLSKVTERKMERRKQEKILVPGLTNVAPPKRRITLPKESSFALSVLPLSATMYCFFVYYSLICNRSLCAVFCYTNFSLFIFLFLRFDSSDP